MDVDRGTAFEACFDSGVAGQVGTASLMLIDNDGGIFWPASTAGIVESPAASGIYCANRTAPIVVGQYTLVWSVDGTYDPATVGIDDLRVLSVGATFPPLTPGDQDSGPVLGPCFGWVEVEDVANCCSVEVGSDFFLFEESATSASQLLYMLSGKMWPGSCQRTVRPRTDAPCGVQVLARGHVVGWDEAWNLNFAQVLLPNYPVTEILEVKIDGTALDATEYRLDGWRWLTRMADANGDAQFWPGPQRRDRESSELDTFEVTYLHGQNPPQPGIDAAAELACEIYKSCPGNEGVAECKLPKNATQVTRAGITISLSAIRYDRTAGRWDTGMSAVNRFLQAYNPHGLKRRPAIWSPDAPRFAEEVGTTLGS